MATATDTRAPIATRVAELRELATSDPRAAQEATWGWFKELGERRDEAKLGELYELGEPPLTLDGPTEGILVVPLIQGAFDRFATTLTGAWMPWLGKSFDSNLHRGYNRLAPSARWPAKLFWPFYSTSEDEDARGAFDFETAIEPGKADPGVQVLKIDYGPVSSNPRLVIRRIRDELVQIVPDTYLGKILWRSGDGDEATYSCIGYFALRQLAG
ncbi:MAG: hypothetical protein QOI10_79 [Solirubrobacterales bacterium]|jgi:hypothetical protein|nr:hypothetical protein [Solirubrobacterales bacterium]